MKIKEAVYMKTKNFMITCIWSNDDFVIVENRNASTSDEATLKINEGTETISVTIPSSISLIAKKIIERRVQSIAKSGFSVPNTSLRIGGGFKVEMNKTDEIPDILLQEGHKYTFGEILQPIQSTPEPESRPSVSSESEYVPSFLAHKPEIDEFVSDITPESQSISKNIETQPIKSLSEETSVFQDQFKPDPNRIAGSFIVALAEYGDVYLSKKQDVYSIEYTMGRIDFCVKDLEIEILSTQRIPENDKTIQNALDKAMKGNS
jgi:hypothetical protein